LDFDRVWGLTLSGLLRFSWLAFTEPHRGSAAVISIEFSNEFEE